MRKTERRKLILNPIIKTQKQEKKVKIHVHLPVRTYGTMYKAQTFTLEDSVLLLGSARESAANNARFL